MLTSAWPRCLIILATTMLLTGCVTVGSSTAVKIVCPTIKQYDRATLEAAYQEYRRLAAGSEIKKMVNDYQVLRDKVRACGGEP